METVDYQLARARQVSALMKTRRHKRGLSQSEVAQVIGVSVMTYSRWERGLAFPQKKWQLVGLKQALGGNPGDYRTVIG
jgi:DNA-binding XRE family transcriptional regulator